MYYLTKNSLTSQTTLTPNSALFLCYAIAYSTKTGLSLGQVFEALGEKIKIESPIFCKQSPYFQHKK
jgi:hypothetical protein